MTEREMNALEDLLRAATQAVRNRPFDPLNKILLSAILEMESARREADGEDKEE